MKSRRARFSSVARIELPGIEELSNSHVCLTGNKVKQGDWRAGNMEYRNNSSSVSYWWRGPRLLARFISKKCHKFINYDGWLCGQHRTWPVVELFGRWNAIPGSGVAMGWASCPDWHLSSPETWLGAARNARTALKLKWVLF